MTAMNAQLHHCPPWALRAWPPLSWQVGHQQLLPLQHLGTQISHIADASCRNLGQTLWAWHSMEGDVGLAWDWVQLTCGVVAMADPMAVVTNLRLVGPAGDVLTPYQSAQHFTAIVHRLPWQLAVERAVEHAVAQARQSAGVPVALAA